MKYTRFLKIIFLLGISILLESCWTLFDTKYREVDFTKDQGCYSLDDFHEGGLWSWRGTIHYNICLSKSGQWVESDGMNLRYGNIIQKDGAYFGCLKVFRLHSCKYDSITRACVPFYQKEYLGQDTSMLDLGVDNDGNFYISGDYPSPLPCWEYKISDDSLSILDSLDTPRIRYCDTTK